MYDFMKEKICKIKDLPTHERPREKLLEKGAQALADWELLAIKNLSRLLMNMELKCKHRIF